MQYELVSLALRLSLGLFFMFSGYHKLFNDQRRKTLAATFKADGVPSKGLLLAIPMGEAFGGLGLLVGALTHVASVGLLLICLGACYLDGRKRVEEWKPLDWADRIDDWLYLPEFLYIVMLLVLLAVGPGSVSVDAVLWSYVR
jgi:uncharacterized membrane protein YphA (DoxX/SURF4 family)